MKILSVVSRLLDYPDGDLQRDKVAMLALVQQAKLGSKLETRMQLLIEDLLAKDLMTWQSEYDALFERGRSLALWLFEHVHGESRDRGQAMVDLLASYREAGLEISRHELPDYIPLFLEFLSTQGDDNARAWLVDVEHILGLLQCRLEQRDSDYSLLFEVLLKLANSRIDLKAIRARIANEKRDDSKAAIDKEWEEEEVTFGAESLDKACESSKRRPSEKQRKDLDIPISWVDFNAGHGQVNNPQPLTKEQAS